MKYIKTYERIIRPSLEFDIYNKFLYPVELSELPDLIDYFKKINVDFKV